MIEVRRGVAPFFEVIEPLAADTRSPLMPRADWELLSLSGATRSVQIPYAPDVSLGQEVSVCVEGGEIVAGVVSYVEQIVREGQAVTAIKLVP